MLYGTSGVRATVTTVCHLKVGMLNLGRCSFALFLLLCSASFVQADSASSWQGAYFGAHAGGTRSSADTTADYAILGLRPNEVELSDAGVLAGVHAGYLWQIQPSLVLGVEGDVSFADIEDEGSGTFVTDAGVPLTLFSEPRADIQWLSSIRARLGYAWGPLMLYGTGGVAWGKVSMSGNITRSTNNLFDGPRIPFLDGLYDDSDSKILTGWVAGGGLDYKLYGNWVLGAEYLHYDLGDETLVSRQDNSGDFVTYDFNTRVNVGRATFKYKF